MNMELESLLSFKQTYFEPRCVLVLTLDKNIQNERLVNQGSNETECQVGVNRTDWYAEFNRNHPGFFDAVISTDNINEGYENLRNLVLNYLGVANQDQKDSMNQQNLQIQRQLSMLQSSRLKTNDDFKRDDNLDLPRTGNFYVLKVKSINSFLILLID